MPGITTASHGYERSRGPGDVGDIVRILRKAIGAAEFGRALAL